MKVENRDKVKEVFNAVVGLDPKQRPLFLGGLCDGDLRREVESLLAAHGKADALYDTPVLKVPTAMLVEFGDFAGRVGAYKIEREIGRGGGGRVAVQCCAKPSPHRRRRTRPGANRAN